MVKLLGTIDFSTYVRSLSLGERRVIVSGIV